MVVPIRWGDMDAMGHVSNAVYFRFISRRCASTGCAASARCGPDGIRAVIVNAFCSFIRQLEYPGEVLAKHYVAKDGRTSFDTYLTLERTDQPGGDLQRRRCLKTVGSIFRSRSRCRCPTGCAKIVE